MLLWVLRLFALFIGAAHAAISIHDHMMNEDGISYLDLGDRYARGEWQPNSMWSPLYPLLLGIAIRVTQPSPRWEFAVAHLATLAIYIGALAAFEFFWRGAWRSINTHDSAEAPTITFTQWAWWVSGYALFVWSSVVLIRFRAVSPDMLVAGLVYLAAGLLVRTPTTDMPRTTYALLGVVLGIGYLAKTILLPVGIVFLIAAAALAWRSPERRRTWLVAPVTFIVVAAPLILALSVAKGRITFGDAGPITYLKHVNDVWLPDDAGAIPAEFGVPIHPIRRVHERPVVVEFATPVPGTYPPGYDPSYWFEGLRTRIEPLRQVRELGKNAFFYAEVFLRQLGGPLALIALLLWVGRRRPWPIWPVQWPLTLIAVAAIALALYAPVWVEGRYIAPFVIMCYGGLLALVRIPDTGQARRALGAVGILLPALIMVDLAAFDAPYARRFLSPGRFAWERRMAADRADAPWRIADALHRFGVQPGDRIGFIGYGFGATFARLAKVQIVAEMPWKETEAFWRLDAPGRERVLQSFAATGAVAVITEVRPPQSAVDGWTELAGSGRYAINVKDVSQSARSSRSGAPVTPR